MSLSSWWIRRCHLSCGSTQVYLVTSAELFLTHQAESMGSDFPNSVLTVERRSIFRYYIRLDILLHELLILFILLSPWCVSSLACEVWSAWVRCVCAGNWIWTAVGSELGISFLQSSWTENLEELEENTSLGAKDRFSITHKKNLYTCFQRELKSSALACVQIRIFSLCKSHVCHA